MVYGNVRSGTWICIDVNGMAMALLLHTPLGDWRCAGMAGMGVCANEWMCLIRVLTFEPAPLIDVCQYKVVTQRSTLLSCYWMWCSPASEVSQAMLLIP